MANTKSALKRLRSARRRFLQNRVYRSGSRTAIKKARLLIESGQLDEARAAVREASSVLDKAAEKGIIHKNNAARHKSRLSQHIRNMGA